MIVRPTRLRIVLKAGEPAEWQENVINLKKENAVNERCRFLDNIPMGKTRCAANKAIPARCDICRIVKVKIYYDY